MLGSDRSTNLLKFQIRLLVTTPCRSGQSAPVCPSAADYSQAKPERRVGGFLGNLWRIWSSSKRLNLNLNLKFKVRLFMGLIYPPSFTPFLLPFRPACNMCGLFGHE